METQLVAHLVPNRDTRLTASMAKERARDACWSTNSQSDQRADGKT